MKEKEFEKAVKNVFDSCKNLSKFCGGVRKFTPDGRMVGDIGEVIAERFYGVELYKEGANHWDGKCKNRNVQIKTTGRNETYLRKPPEEGFGNGLLMVFQINKLNGKHELIYSGKIQKVWDYLGGSGKERTISLDRLKTLQKSVNERDIILKLKNN